MGNKYEVNGLPLPPLLIELIQNNEWSHPGDEILKIIVPYIHEPVDFLTAEQMKFETSGFLVDDPRSSFIFYAVRGSRQNIPTHMPWLDVENAVFVAVNRFPGADVGIALDYRTDWTNPRVVANDWWSMPDHCIWQEVAPTFSQFIEQIKLVKKKS